MRSTIPTVLGHVDGQDAPPAGAPTEEGLLTVVGPTREGRIRGLPSLFFGPELVFAHRDLAEVSRRVAVWIDASIRSARESIYTLTACRIGDAYGLYGVDAFNRSRYRRELTKLGVDFSTDPFVRFVGDATFACNDWGDFSPRFVALGGAGDSSDQVFRTKGAELAFVLTTYRMGGLQQEELRGLIETAVRVDGMNAGSASALVTALGFR